MLVPHEIRWVKPGIPLFNQVSRSLGDLLCNWIGGVRGRGKIRGKQVGKRKRRKGCR